VRRRFRGERAEERERDVHAVEVVDVVLAGPAGAGTTDRLLGVRDRGGELDQVAVVLADRQFLDELLGDRRLDLRRIDVDQRRVGGDGDVLAERTHAEGHARLVVLPEQDVHAAGDSVQPGEGVRHAVTADREQRQAVLTRFGGDGGSGLRKDGGTRFDGHSRKERAVCGRDPSADRAGLLRECEWGGK
jgi:hypothetical protein